MPKEKATCEAVFRWLRLNLGRGALAPLTGTDWRALAAAAHTIELYAVSGEPGALRAFHELVMCMQPKTRELAYHAIAQCMEWDSRAVIWRRAGLDPLEHVQRCEGER